MKHILSIILFLMLTLETFSTNYYISTTGLDANAGTSSATAKLTLANVFSTKNLANGDTIFIAAGTYTDKTITVGSDDEGFVIQGAALSNGVPTTIYDSDQSSYWLRMNNGNNDNITINNIKVKDYKGGSSNGGALRIGLGVDGITGSKVNYCIFENCDTQSTQGGGAIYVGSSSSSTLSVTYSTFYSCDVGSAGGGAIYVEYAGMASGDLDITISNSKFYNNTSGGHGSAVLINGFSGSTINISNSVFYSNQCTSSSSNGVVYTNLYSVMTMTNCTLYGNTALSSPSVQTGGIYLFGGGVTANTATITNCISYGNSNYDIYEANGTVNVKNSCYQNQYSTTPTNCITANPQFVDVANYDFNLLSTSPCVNAGTNTGAPLSDYDGSSREGTADMGAYEYVTPPSLPIDLLYFVSKAYLGYNVISWASLTETNNDYYSIFYSMNNSEWKLLVKITGNGNSSSKKEYRYTHQVNKPGMIYYLLEQTDYDGTTKTFDPIGVKNLLTEKVLLYRINSLGQQVNETYKGIVFYVYSDDSIEQKYQE